MVVRIVPDETHEGVRFDNPGLYDQDVLGFERAVKRFWAENGGRPRQGVYA